MSIFREIPPTAGFNIPLLDFISAISVKQNALEEGFKNYLGVEYARVTNSGTAALYLIFETLKDLSPKRTIIIPAFICPLVPLAAARAGLKVEVCDIQQDSFDFDYNALENICSQNQDILAIVAVHLAGIPLEFERVDKLCRKFNIFSVEDCAQALGALYLPAGRHDKGKQVGSLGDFSFFSLCRGKGLTIYEGGVLVTRHKDYAKLVDEKMRILVKSAPLSELFKIIELFGYSIFYRPHLFWWVFRLPQLFWRIRGDKLREHIEYFSADFPVHAVSGIRRKIGYLSFLRLENELLGQSKRAGFLKEGLKSLNGISIVSQKTEGSGADPYLTLLSNDTEAKDKLEKALGSLGFSSIYEFAISEYKYLSSIIPQKKYPNAQYFARHSFTLSTSKFLNKKDLSRMIDTINIFRENKCF